MHSNTVLFGLLALFLRTTCVEAAPTLEAGNVISISAADIANNDLTGYESHPGMNTYRRWLQNSPHAEAFRRNASAVVARHPSLEGVECDSSKDECLLTSRMAMSSDMVAKRDASSIWGDMDQRFVEVHYKTYHWLEHKDRDPEYAGYEHYIEYNWKCRSILYRCTGQIMADHSMETGHFSSSSGHMATVHTTALRYDETDAPVHNEKLVVLFGCTLFNGKCCLNGGYEQLFIDGVESVYAAKTERTCNNGYQLNKNFECYKNDKAVSIMMEQDGDHFNWVFYETPQGQTGGCNTDKPAVFKGPDFTGEDIDEPPYPSGDYGMNIWGQQCEWRGNGENPGILICGGKEFSCNRAAPNAPTVDCPNTGRKQHEGAYCEFNLSDLQIAKV